MSHTSQQATLNQIQLKYQSNIDEANIQMFTK